MQDDVIIFTKNDYRVSPTSHTSEEQSLQSEPASQTQGQSERTTAINPASITAAETRGRSAISIPISFDSLTEDPVPLKRCVLWNRRAFMVRTMASAKDKRGGREWSREEQHSEREAEAFG